MGKRDGKIAVTTGGSTGMALAGAKLFVDEGAHVFIQARRQDALDDAVKLIGRNVTAVQGDADEQALQLKQNQLRRADLDDFVDSYAPGKPRDSRVASERWIPFTYDELVARDKANLDITWLRDDSLEDLDNPPAPEVIAREIVDDLTAALVEFEAVAAALEKAAVRD